MTARYAALGFIAVFFAALIAATVYPPIDLRIAAQFYKTPGGFYLEHYRFYSFIHYFAIKGAWYGGFAFVALFIISFFRRKGFIGVSSKGWVFLLLALVVGPGLIANAGLKDHWGRARPREVHEFGGPETFSPALIPQKEEEGNGSFVAGDGAFGSYLHSIAYLVPLSPTPRRSRRTFWGLVALGGVFGYVRIAMGAHFFSDVLYAALFMFMASAMVHAALFGWGRTRDYWRGWLGLPPQTS